MLTSSVNIFLLLLRIKDSCKYFSDHLNNQCNNSILIQPTNSEEIAILISTLNMNKSSGPNSIHYKILNLLKKYIPKQLADLFNLFFIRCLSSLLKVTKVVPVYKKDSKLDCHNYRFISWKNTEKANVQINFWLKIIVSMTCSLVSDKTFLLDMPW